MSAFICSDKTTNALAQLAPAEFGDRQAIADLLRAENTRSVNYRYRDQEPPEPIAFESSAEVPKLSAVAIIKLCDHFDYQACETDDYDRSLAAKIVDAIRRAAIDKAADEVLVEQDRRLARGLRPALPPKDRLVLASRSDARKIDELVRVALSAEMSAAPWGL